MHSKNMSRAFPISGRILWMVSFIILSLLGLHQSTTGSRVRRVPNWCSAMHCEDCAKSEVSICSNGAASNRSGDLCGCCRSCVQIRDFGASCGSQLAVRFAPKNFGNSRSRFAVLATARCRPGLVCINSTCERSEDEVDGVGAAPVERNGERTEAKSESSDNDGSEEPDDLRTNVITVENSHEFYYRRPDYDNVDNSPLDIDDVFTTRETDPERSTSIPWPISLTTEMLPTTIREMSESIESRWPDNDLDSSGHSVNVIMSGREFQLIHGRDALADLKLLLQSLDKTQSPSILDEFEALLLYEHFKDVLELVNSGRKSSSPKEVIDPETGVSTTVDPQEHFENDNSTLVDTVRDSGGLGVLRKFASSRNSKIPRPRIPLRFPSKFRRKRELEDSENEDPRNEFSEVVIDDLFNDTPRTMTDPSRRWFIDREVETTSEQRSPTARLSEPDVLESTINIHITGIPRTTNSASEFELVEEELTNDDARTASTSQDHVNYDDKLEIFVSDANTDFPNFSKADETLEESANLTTSPMSESLKRFESQSGEVENATDNDWQTLTSMGENSGHFGTNYEFTFPESPVIMDDDNALALRVNETVDEFRAQLNRIETKVVVIESSLYNMMTKLGTNKLSAGVADEELRYIESDSFPYSGSTAPGRRRYRRILLPIKEVTNFPEKNSTYAYLGGNGRSFKVEDEGVAQLIPIRSNRRWRTVNSQPGQVEARKVFGSRGGLYPSRSGVEKIREEVDLVPSRKKSTPRRASNSGHQDLIARRTGGRKVSREGPIRSLGKIQSQRYLSKFDPRSSTRPADIFSREQYSLRVTPLRSPQQVVRNLSPARSGLATERTKRRSSEVDGRDSKIEETRLAEESVAMLETQIPKPVLRAGEFKDFDNGMGVSPTRVETIPMEGSLRRSFDEEDNWNWSSWDDGPSLNLFVVNGEETGSSSEFGGEVSSRSRESRTIVLPMENENPGIPEESWETVYPSYLDYSERGRRGEETEKEDGPIKTEASQSSTNQPRARRISAEGGKRMKRAVDFSDEGQLGEAIVSRPKKGLTDRQPTTQKRSSSGQREKRGVQMAEWLSAAQEYDEPLRQVRISAEGGKRMKKRTDFSQAGQFDEAIFLRPKKRLTDRQPTIQNRSSSGQREKRGVQMTDWLRVAQEYEEPLGQVRISAENGKRMKRAVNFSQAEQLGEAIVSRPKTGLTDRQPTIQKRSSSGQREKRGLEMTDWLLAAPEYDEPLQQERIRAEDRKRMKRATDFSQAEKLGEAIVSRPKTGLTDIQPTIQKRSSSGQREKRGLEMTDWLSAAPEYDEPLQQVRISAENGKRMKSVVDFSQAEKLGEAIVSRPKTGLTDRQPTIQNRSSSGQSTKHGVQMTDWLSAAPDYDEPLGQVRISAANGKRMKSVVDFSQAEQLGEAIVSRPKKGLTDRQPTIQKRSSFGQREKRGLQMTDWLRAAQEYEEPLRQVRISAKGGKTMKRASDIPQAGQFGEAIVSRPRKRSTDTQPTIQNRSSSEHRSKRGVQMADWLRAAQEYHERLQQVRTAALGTWLAARDELDDTNLTDVKLFTREIPIYLERYTPTSAEKQDSIPNGDASQVHPIEVEDPSDDPSSIPNDEELFIEFLRNQSASLRNESKNVPRKNKNLRDPSGETSSSTARKFTIIATGNSTIRIEELPESGDEIDESLEDQSAQGSMSLDRRTALLIGESEDFDHMYEGIDAEDGDFDYGDPNLALSRWLDEVDIIDASSVEIPVDKAESTAGEAPKDEEDYEVDELLSRSKRDAPLFLFRVNGEPGQEVLVWPSNWRDFIDRHFRRNRTGNPPQRTTKRTRTRISKLGPARKGVSEATNKNSHERDREISSSAERTSDEGAEKESGMELAFARRFQESFENRPRQNKRKNAYRSNIGNYR